jgi:catecholate siderophore receptor
LVFKPVPYGSIYVAYSNSLTPPGNDTFALSSTGDNINNPNFDPQEATNIEIGTKWDLLDARLALNAAVYRTENKNQLIADLSLNEFIQYGKRRVQGAEFGAVGKITDSWSVIAGLAWSDNEQVEGAVSGTNATGAAARWAPDYSANLWTTYTARKWSAGIGMNYVDEQKLVTTNIPVDANRLGAIPGYTVFNGMLGYTVNDNLGLQLNVYNLFDREYLSSLNNGGTRVRVGVERYAQVAVNFKF